MEISRASICLFALFLPGLAHGYGTIPYQSLNRPITAAKLFPECDPARLKPGTTRTTLCDIWDEHIDYLERKLDAACPAAGEIIYKTIPDVEGFLIKPAEVENKWRPDPFNLYKARIDKNYYVAPAVHLHYRSVEIFLSRNKSYQKHAVTAIEAGSRYPKIDTSITLSSAPTLRYQVEYRRLTTKEERRSGFYGDRTSVRDRLSDEVIAERVIYYYVVAAVTLPDGNLLSMPGKYLGARYFVLCKNYAPRLFGIERNFPPSEYEFVSRVLLPKAPTATEDNDLFDLTKGTGERRKSCVGLQTVGYGITPDDLNVSRAGDDLRLGLRNSNDALICTRYFVGPHWEVRLLFSNGTYWKEKRILELGNIVRNKSP
jgi:hypothetical protein